MLPASAGAKTLSRSKSATTSSTNPHCEALQLKARVQSEISRGNTSRPASSRSVDKPDGSVSLKVKVKVQVLMKALQRCDSVMTSRDHSLLSSVVDGNTLMALVQSQLRHVDLRLCIPMLEAALNNPHSAACASLSAHVSAQLKQDWNLLQAKLGRWQCVISKHNTVDVPGLATLEVEGVRRAAHWTLLPKLRSVQPVAQLTQPPVSIKTTIERRVRKVADGTLSAEDLLDEGVSFTGRNGYESRGKARFLNHFSSFVFCGHKWGEFEAESELSFTRSGEGNPELGSRKLTHNVTFHEDGKVASIRIRFVEQRQEALTQRQEALTEKQQALAQRQEALAQTQQTLTEQQQPPVPDDATEEQPTVAEQCGASEDSEYAITSAEDCPFYGGAVEPAVIEKRSSELLALRRQSCDSDYSMSEAEPAGGCREELDPIHDETTDVCDLTSPTKVDVDMTGEGCSNHTKGSQWRAEMKHSGQAVLESTLSLSWA